MILSFACRETERLYREGKCAAQWRSFERVAKRKLDAVASAKALSDLRVPPRNLLEQLKGDRKGQWSIRINDQWRVCFNWTDDGPSNVEITDYH